MSAPSPVNRAVMLERDQHRCIVCPATTHLEAQHRRAVGMGGSKIRPLLADLVTACSVHNAAFEADLQTRALLCGWKVARWVQQPELVPVFDQVGRQWFRLATDATRVRITEAQAMTLMVEVYGPQYEEWKAAA